MRLVKLGPRYWGLPFGQWKNRKKMEDAKTKNVRRQGRNKKKKASGGRGRFDAANCKPGRTNNKRRIPKSDGGRGRKKASKGGNALYYHTRESRQG